MIKRNYKGRCTKKSVAKAREVCRVYSDIQLAYLNMLEHDAAIAEIRCGVPLDGLEIGAYNTDFVCTKADGERMVRECVNRKLLLKPMTVKLLDASLRYWREHGVQDWGLVINAEE